MAYSKTNWVNDSSPAISAENLNKIENELESLDNGLGDVYTKEEIGDLENLTTTDKTSVVNAVNELKTDKLETSAVLNQASTDTDKTYSADYLNDKLVSVGATAPENGERVWFSKSKNLLDTSKWTHNYINASGGIGSGNTNCLFADYIKVEPNTQYTLGLKASVYNCAISEFNNSRTFIQRNVANNNSVLTITTTNNTEYIRVQFNYDNATSIDQTIVDGLEVQLEEGSTATSYEPYVEEGIYVDEEEWYSKPKVLWSGKATSVDVDLTGYNFIEVIFCSNDNFYNSLKVPVSGSTFSRALALCNSWLSDPMSSSGSLYLKYGKATLTQSGITIKSNVEVQITNTASQIRWQNYGNTLLYITTIIGYK